MVELEERNGCRFFFVLGVIGLLFVFVGVGSGFGRYDFGLIFFLGWVLNVVWGVFVVVLMICCVWIVDVEEWCCVVIFFGGVFLGNFVLVIVFVV